MLQFGRIEILQRVACVVLAVGLVAGGRADDLYPPPWDRFTEDTGFAHWDFSDPNLAFGPDPMWPDAGSYPQPIPMLHAPHAWHATHDARVGVIEAADGTYVLVPAATRLVDTYLQCVFHDDAPLDSLYVAGYPKNRSADITVTHEFQYSGSDWWYRRYHIKAQFWEYEYGLALLAPSPGQSILLDQVVIDWTPEPASRGLVAAGLVLWLPWKRRAA